MGSGWRTALALIAIALVVVSGAVAFLLVHSSKNQADAATVYAFYVGVVSVAVAILVPLGSWWFKGRQRAASHISTPAQIRAAADWLAGTSARKWRTEAAARRIITPAPATIRWRWAAEEITASRAEVTARPAPGAGPLSMPELGSPGELLASGVVKRLHDEVYARLPYGRLVLTGGPGAGKTGAMILLLLAALDMRKGLTDEQADRVPVPVWLTLGGWDPATRSLPDWVTSTMNRDFPGLREQEGGPDMAGELLRAGRVSLFLDGLDEMPEGLRAFALKRIDDEAQGLRVVVTSRPAEYRGAISEGRPSNTAVIELRPVRPDAAAAYLLRDQAGRSRQQWEQVGAYLRADPYSVAARALDNPLTLSLARDTYVGQDPAVLTDTDRFPTVEAIRGHLMDRFLVIAYPRDVERERAVYWLAWIARGMRARQDLQWWDIPGWVADWKLRLSRGVAAGLVTGLAAALATTLLSRQSLSTGLTAGALIGLSAGLLGGLMARLRRRTSAQGRGPLLDRRRVRGIAGAILGSIGFGALLVVDGGGGVATGITTGIFLGLLTGAGFWLGSRLGFGLAGAPQTLVLRWPRPSQFIWVLVALWFPPVLLSMLLNLWATPIADSPSATAMQTYRTDRRTSIIYGLAYAIPIGLWAGVLAGLANANRSGLTFAVISSIGWAILAGSATWFTAWLVAGQVPLMKLSELTLMTQRKGRVHFLPLLQEASVKQVLRQVGPVYQFRHAVFQAHLAAMHGQDRPIVHEPRTGASAYRGWPVGGNPEHTIELFQYYARNFGRAAAESTAGPVVAGDVPREAPSLQTRTELAAGLAGGEPGTPLIRVVTGGSGVGKTQLAAAYARTRIDAGWRLVAWVNADDPIGMLTGLSDAAARLGIGDPGAGLEATGTAVRRWLEGDGSRCLVVFDEVSDIDLIRRFLPAAGKAHVLIACTGRCTPESAVALPVSVFSEREALSFLADRTRRPDTDQAQPLVRELSYWPLALAHAGAVIAGQQLGYDAYLARLRANAEHRALAPPGGEPYPQGVAEAISICLAAVAAADRTGLSGTLMDLISVLSAAGLPRALLHAAGQVGLIAAPAAGDASAGGKLAPQAIDQALGQLAAASLLTFTADSAILAAHRLVMQVIRDQHARQGDLATVAAGAVNLLGAAAASVNPVSTYRVAARVLVQQIIALREHVIHDPGTDGVTERLLALRCWVLSCLNELGDNPGQAIEQGELLVSDLERIRGPDHVDTLAARNDLALAYQAAGRTSDAVPLFERTLEDRERILGHEHPDTVITRSNLARAYYAAGRNADALPLLRRTLKDRERILGSDHPDTLTARNYLALAYLTARQIRNAVPLFDWNLADAERILGFHHPDTQIYRHNLAMAYLEARRYLAAIPMFRSHITDCERLLRPGDPRTLADRAFLAVAYEETRQIGKAVPLLERNLSDCERFLGADSADTRYARGQLARVYQRTRRTADAILLLERNLGDDERLLAPGSPETLTTRRELIAAYLRLGRAADAIPLLERNLSDCERTYGPEHALTLAARSHLADAVTAARRARRRRSG